jgi:hypothetical protein
MSSTSSAESAASASASNGPVCEPSHSARSTTIADVSSPSIGQMSPVTTTCEVLPLNGSAQMELLPMSSRPDSRVRTSATLEVAPELRVSEAAYGKTAPELFANYDHASSSWRTSQRSLIEGWTVFSETWPRSGTMRNGIAYQLPALVPLTDEIASGYWPTPSARDWKDTPGMARQAGNRDRTDQLARAIYAAENARSGSGSLSPAFVEWLMGFPLGWTVCEASATPSSHKSRKSSVGQS